MTIILDLLPDTERKLKMLATNSGKDIASLVHDWIDERIQTTFSDERAGSPGSNFDAITTPLRQDFKDSGMTEEDLGAMIEEAREDVWQERQKAGREA